jgi:hypothetical protein
MRERDPKNRRLTTLANPGSSNIERTKKLIKQERYNVGIKVNTKEEESSTTVITWA